MRSFGCNQRRRQVYIVVKLGLSATDLYYTQGHGHRVPTLKFLYIKLGLSATDLYYTQGHGHRVPTLKFLYI